MSREKGAAMNLNEIIRGCFDGAALGGIIEFYNLISDKPNTTVS